MTTATVSHLESTTGSAGTRSLWRTGALAGGAAAAATVAVAGAAHGLGVPVETEPGTAIPILGFAQLTLFFSAVGVVLARSLARRADRPRSRFVVTTVALTALSFVPDVLLSTDAASKLTLVTTHLVAAAIVIPALAARLAVQSA
jgi:hypothetical protein